MTNIESTERAVTKPDIFNNRVVRVEPNARPYPEDADIIVETEPEDYHVLTFRVGRSGEDKHIFLTDAQPPLDGTEVADDRTFWVRGDVLVKGREFELAAALPYLAKTSFRAITMQSNVEIVDSPFKPRS
jgi:hypothetical protein